MMKSVDEIIAELPPERRAEVARRLRELLEAERLQRQRVDWRTGIMALIVGGFLTSVAAPSQPMYVAFIGGLILAGASLAYDYWGWSKRQKMRTEPDGNGN